MPWYAIYVRSQTERSVADRLSSQRIEGYLPSFRRRHRWQDRSVFLEEPVFPGYVFARFESPDRTRVLSIPGVVRILGQPAMEPIPDTDISAVRLLVDAGERMEAAKAEGPPKGTRVRVTGGPLMGAEGICQRVKRGYRIVVQIRALGQSISAEVDLLDVSVLDARAETRRGARKALPPPS